MRMLRRREVKHRVEKLEFKARGLVTDFMLLTTTPSGCPFDILSIKLSVAYNKNFHWVSSNTPVGCQPDEMHAFAEIVA